jgi:hypothetical protein
MMDELNIPAERDLPRLEHKARLFAREVTARRRRRRVALVVAPALAILLLAATGFTTYVLTKTEPTHLDTIGCYDRAALDADVAVIGSGAGDPVSSCREAWQQGAFPGPVPGALAACVLQTGAIGVFPSARPGTCGQLGLAPLSAAGIRESRRFAALRDAIEARIGVPASGSSRRSSLCVGEDEARTIVRQELDSHGYRDWRVRIVGGGFTAARPCAELSFDSEGRAVLLVGAPRS